MRETIIKLMMVEEDEFNDDFEENEDYFEDEEDL